MMVAIAIMAAMATLIHGKSLATLIEYELVKCFSGNLVSVNCENCRIITRKWKNQVFGTEQKDGSDINEAQIQMVLRTLRGVTYFFGVSESGGSPTMG